jgi:DNA-binding response OmpR family regulator
MTIHDVVYVDPNIKVLLVEDAAVIQLAMKRFLENELDFNNIHCADDGLQALEIFKQAKNQGSDFQFIITDIMMPKLNSLKFLRAVREIDPQIPVLIVSSEADRKTVMKAIELGANNYIIKPLKVRELALKINKIFPKP